jgi:predicted nucleic acid-binding protein
MSDESIECSHVEWVYAEDRCALCGITAVEVIAGSHASLAAHMREAAEQQRMWEERAPLRAAIARESASFKAWTAKQAAERAAVSPRPAFPARALRMGPWTIGDLVE